MATYVTKSIYPRSLSKHIIEKEIKNEIIEKVGHIDAANDFHIEWHDEIVNSHKEAVETLKEKYKTEENKAITFRNMIEPDNEEYKIAKERLKQAIERFERANNRIHYAQDDMVVKYITCRTCGSSIARKYIKYNECPICNGDLRPISTLERIKSLQISMDKARKTVKAMEENNKKVGMYWLVIYEYTINEKTIK